VAQNGQGSDGQVRPPPVCAAAMSPRLSHDLSVGRHL